MLKRGGKTSNNYDKKENNWLGIVHAKIINRYELIEWLSGAEEDDAVQLPFSIKEEKMYTKTGKCKIGMNEELNGT